MNDTLGVCIVGAGGIGRAHAKTYAALAGRVALSFFDVDPARAAEAARQFGARTFDRYGDVLAAPEVDVVDLCLPHDAHVRATVAAAQANKHILLEKPIARTLQEADEILAAIARLRDRTFMVAECWRFYPVVNAARRLIEQGAIGRVGLIQSNSIQRWSPPGWRADEAAMGGGCLLDRGVHFVDMMLNLGGPVASVFSFEGPDLVPDMSGEDTSIVALRYASGALGQIVTSWGLPQAPPTPWFAAYGDAGCLFDFNGLHLLTNTGCQPAGHEPVTIITDPTSQPPGMPPGADAEMVDLTIRHFVDCVLNDVEPAYTPQMARQALEIVVAAYRSADTGRLVPLPA